MQPVAQPARNAALDGLRGWAALTVVFYHSVLEADPGLVARVLHRPVQDLATPRDVAAKLVLAVLNGETAVQVFFVISGLVLFRSLRRLAPAGPARAAWIFTLRRVLRLYPALIACLLATVALQAALAGFGLPAAPIDPAALLRNALLLGWEVNGATWTLHAEVAMIPVLLLCFAATRILGAAALAAALLASVIAIPLRARLGLGDAVLAACPFFLAGALIEQGAGAAWLRRPAAPLLALPCLLAATLLLPHAWPLRLLLQAGAVSLLVGWVYNAGAAQAGALCRPLSQWLGLLSYGVYLWNVPIFEVMLRLIDPALRLEWPLEAGLAVGLATTALTLPIAALSERWVERPCIGLGHRLTSTRLPGSATPRGGHAPRRARSRA